jgi:hypothetical protein
MMPIEGPSSGGENCLVTSTTSAASGSEHGVPARTSYY